MNVSVQESTRVVRIAPGEKDLKKATFIQLRDVQVGDRILARGESSDGGKSVMASSVILMKESDLTAKQEHDREDWQKRGVGGLVSKVDAANGTITLSAPTIGDAKTGRLLGVHIVGAEASNLISECALALEMGAAVEDLALTVHPHPTLPETLMEAAEATLGHAIHIFKPKSAPREPVQARL